MKVSSPVGDFPFEARRLTVKNGRLVLEGAMGAWPAKVEMEPGDVVRMARLVPWPVVAFAGLAMVGVLARRRRKGEGNR